MAFLQLQNLWVSELADGVASLVLDVPGGRNNHINRRVLDELEQALDRVESDGRFRLLVIKSGKENQFAAGPGLDDLAALKRPEEFADLAEKGQHVCARLQSLLLPTVAVVSGVCQGGGLELALACDYRVMVQNPSARLTLAGSDLGLMPAWGATQRLPRLIGLERSLQMLLGDRPLSPEQARQWGLADAVVQQSDELPPAFLGDAHKRPLGFLPGRTWRQWLIERFRWGRWLILNGADSVLKRRLPDELPGPWEILEAVRCGLDQGMPAGLERERAALARLSQQPAFRNLLRIQQDITRIRRDAGSTPDGRDDTAISASPTGYPFSRIGIVGAGATGLQFLTLAVSRGCHVVVREANETALGQALFLVLSHFVAAVQAGTLSADDFQKQMAAIQGTTAWKGFRDLDLVLETLGPDPNQRKQMLQQMEQETEPRTWLVAATGDQSLGELRDGLMHPERVGGLHCVPPVARGSVFEVVGPPAVEPRLAGDLSAFVVRLGGIPVLIQDRPGLLVQRIWLAAILEAMLLLQEHVPVDRIDEALRRFGMLRGPLEFADLIGLQRLENLAAGLESILPARFYFDPLLGLMIDQGWLGQKSKLGFYRHEKKSKRPNPKLPGLIRAEQGLDVKVEFLSPQEQRERCQERIVARSVNEAAWCLHEGVAGDARTIDLAMALSGWAPHRGGPLTYARQQGTRATVDLLARLAQQCGERFLPCPALPGLEETCSP